MSIISSLDIKKFGSYSDRKNSYDDNKELIIVSNFIKNYSDPNDIIKFKPFGERGIDLGVFDSQNNLKFVVDVERWKVWDHDWPANYRYISFLERKEKYLKYSQFVMIFFNYSLNKLIRVKKDDILKFSPEKRYTQGKYDTVRKIPFQYGKMYGTGFSEREKSIFDCELFDLKNDIK